LDRFETFLTAVKYFNVPLAIKNKRNFARLRFFQRFPIEDRMKKLNSLNFSVSQGEISTVGKRARWVVKIAVIKRMENIFYSFLQDVLVERTPTKTRRKKWWLIFLPCNCVVDSWLGMPHQQTAFDSRQPHTLRPKACAK